MNEWTIEPSSHDRDRSAIGTPGDRERKRVVPVELLLGGFRLPGFLEFSATGDQVTFTIKPRLTARMSSQKEVITR